MRIRRGWLMVLILPVFLFSHMAMAEDAEEESTQQVIEQSHQEAGGADQEEKAVRRTRMSKKRQEAQVGAEAGEQDLYPRYAEEVRMLVRLSKETGIKPRELASMLEAIRRERDIQDILDGRVDAARVASAYAAVKGTLPFNPIGHTGRAINKLTGESVVYDKKAASLADQAERAKINRNTAATRKDNSAATRTNAAVRQKNVQINAVSGGAQK